MSPIRVFLASAFTSWLLASQIVAQQADKPELVRMTLKGGRAVVGQILSQDDDELRLLDVKTGEQPVIKRKTIQIAPKKLADDEAIRAVGFSNFLAWRLKQTLGESKAGKIAEITPSVIYVSLGTKNGIEKGQKLVVFRDNGVVRDPDTGDILTRRIAKIANLEVTDVEESFLKAKLLGNLEIQLLVGDVVRIDRPEKMIAVLPLTDTLGKSTEDGRAFSEELTTGLVRNGIAVVERSQLDKVLGELKLQQTKLFDPDVAQKLGEQLSAFAIVGGTIVLKEKFAEAHVRIIKVDSGEILSAHVQRITGSDKKPENDERDAVSKKVVRSNDESVNWKNHNSLKDEKTFKADWFAGQYQVETRGLRLTNDGAFSSKFECLDGARVEITLAQVGRNFIVEFCGKKINLTSATNGQAAETDIISLERRGNKLNYQFVGNGKIAARDTILLEVDEVNKPSSIKITPNKAWSVSGGEPLLKSIVINGRVKLAE